MVSKKRSSNVPQWAQKTSTGLTAGVLFCIQTTKKNVTITGHLKEVINMWTEFKMYDVVNNNFKITITIYIYNHKNIKPFVEWLIQIKVIKWSLSRSCWSKLICHIWNFYASFLFYFIFFLTYQQHCVRRIYTGQHRQMGGPASAIQRVLLMKSDSIFTLYTARLKFLHGLATTAGLITELALSPERGDPIPFCFPYATIHDSPSTLPYAPYWAGYKLKAHSDTNPYSSPNTNIGSLFSES